MSRLICLLFLGSTALATEPLRIQPSSKPQYRPRAEVATIRLDPRPTIEPKLPVYKSLFACPIPQAIELVVLGEDRPHRIRVNVRIAEKTIDLFWKMSLRKLFDHFDRDGDGFLNRYEVEYAITQKGIAGLLKGEVYIPYQNNDPGPNLDQWDRDRDGRVSFDEYYDEVTKALVVPFRLSSYVPSGELGVLTNQKLMALFDANHDGVISDQEFEDIRNRIAKFDTDGDGFLTKEELPLPRPKIGRIPIPTEAIPTAGKPSATPKLPVIPESILVDVEPLPLPAWGPLPPDVEITLNVGGQLDPGKIYKIQGQTSAVKTLGSDTLVVTLGAKVMEIRAKLYVSTPALSGRDEIAFQPDQYNSKGDYILESELGNKNQLMRFIFDHADHDGNGKLTRDEYTDYIALQKLIATLPLVIISRQGPPDLWALLDANGDKKLSKVELSRAKEILRSYQPTGPITNKALDLAATVEFGSETYDSKNRMMQTQVAPPIWFLKMDTNGDGEVTMKEFLGTAAQFQAIDTNGDGYISTAEAIAASAKKKK